MPIDDSERPETEVGVIVGAPAADDSEPRGVYVMGPHHTARSAFTPRTLAAPRHRIIYMNRDGGTFTPGSNDSASNRSTIVSWTASVPRWNVSDAGWREVMDCMRELWAPFDVEITDVDPGDVDHLESVVAGNPQDVGMSSGVGGVSPFDCGIIERSVVFTFAEVYGSDYRAICETAAQEVAHSYGLDHEYMCEDPMTYLYGCGEKEFQDTAARCGEYNARNCNCGGSTQNSVELLTLYNGSRPDDPTNPPDDPTDPSDDAGDPFDQDDADPDLPDPVTDGDSPGDDGADLGPITGGCQTGGSGGPASGFAILLAIGWLGRRKNRRARR